MYALCPGVFVIIFFIIQLYLHCEYQNILLDREEFSFGKWFGFAIITCGLYHIYHEYIFGQGIDEAQQKHNVPIKADNLPVLSIVLAIFGLSLISDAIQQKEINVTIESASQNRGN